MLAVKARGGLKVTDYGITDPYPSKKMVRRWLFAGDCGEMGLWYGEGTCR